MVEKCPFDVKFKSKIACFGESREDETKESKKTNQLNNNFDALSVNSTRRTIDLSDNEANLSVKNTPREENSKAECPYKSQVSKLY
jgi:hypothetical protein